MSPTFKPETTSGQAACTLLTEICVERNDPPPTLLVVSRVSKRGLGFRSYIGKIFPYSLLTTSKQLTWNLRRSCALSDPIYLEDLAGRESHGKENGQWNGNHRI